MEPFKIEVSYSHCAEYNVISSRNQTHANGFFDTISIKMIYWSSRSHVFLFWIINEFNTRSNKQKKAKKTALSLSKCKCYTCYLGNYYVSGKNYKRSTQIVDNLSDSHLQWFSSYLILMNNWKRLMGSDYVWLSYHRSQSELLKT